MSRIGKKPIAIPEGVKVEQNGRHLKVSGSLGVLEMDCHPRIESKVDTSAMEIQVINKHSKSRYDKQLHGTMRALISNMVVGVSKGFSRSMEIYGTGYNVKQNGDNLVLQVGFCHSVEMKIPEGVSVNIEVPSTRGNEVPAKFTIQGVDKQQVCQFAADVRSVRSPEPYKGKGIRYQEEHISLKVGKAFTSGAV